MPHNIVETAKEAGNFQTLLTAVDAAGLGETLADGGPFTAFAPTDDSEQKTVEGGVLTIGVNGGVTVNDAAVIQADVEADNGVIHVIDRVLIPAA